MADAEFETLREEMVEQVVLYASFIGEETGHSAISPEILNLMRSIPRHEFVPANLRAMAYVDSPLPIGHGKTISQPFIVALMSDLLQVQPDDRILEVGTGLGYQAAILATLAETVYSIEIIEELAREAGQALGGQGHTNTILAIGDGSLGWPERLCCKPDEGVWWSSRTGGRLMILRWPDGPAAAPWPRSERTVLRRRHARRFWPRR